MSLRRAALSALFLAGMLAAARPAAAQTKAQGNNLKTTTTSAVAGRPSAEDIQIEGEKRFHANCGRCHQAPHKFPPRMMATIVRHMRVRATITDEDMRLILLYMTQ